MHTAEYPPSIHADEVKSKRTKAYRISKWAQNEKRREISNLPPLCIYGSRVAYALGSSSWAIITALSAAPRSSWSATTHKARPLSPSTVASRRTRPT